MILQRQISYSSHGLFIHALYKFCCDKQLWKICKYVISQSYTKKNSLIYETKKKSLVFFFCGTYLSFVFKEGILKKKLIDPLKRDVSG